MGEGPFDVSIVMPLYDKADYVVRAIESVLGQTHPAREIIVVDDGSTDNGPERVARLAATTPCIRLIKQANAGPSAARNRGIAEARGAWIAFLDADDAFLPHHLANLAAMAAKHPEAGMLAAAYREVREGEHAAAAAEIDANRTAGSGAIVENFFRRWCQGAFFFTSSAAIRRCHLQAFGDAFPLGERMGEDHDVWFRVAERTSVAWTPVAGSLYTVGLAESLTGRLTVTDPLPCYQRLRDRLRLAEFPQSQRAGAQQLVATHWLNIARARALIGDSRGACRLIADPIARKRPLYWLRTLVVVAANSGPWWPLRLGRI